MSNPLAASVADNPAEILSVRCVWALQAPKALFHGKWEHAYFESHAWCEQHTIASSLSRATRVMKCDGILFFFFVNAHYTSYPMKYSFHLGNVRTACVCRCSKKKKKKKKTTRLSCFRESLPSGRKNPEMKQLELRALNRL